MYQTNLGRQIAKGLRFGRNLCQILRRIYHQLSAFAKILLSTTQVLNFTQKKLGN